MSVRLRRLKADYERIMTEFTGHKYIKVEPVSGMPPEKYLVTYKLKGLKWDENLQRPVEISFHQVVIELQRNYPREKPKCTMKTEIFHPNFGTWVCIGDYWAAGETLVDIIIKIGNMIQYKDYNYKSPLNHIAAEWVKENEHLLPVGKIDLYQPEPEVEIGEEIPETDNLEITLEDKGQENVDDIDIDIK